MENWRIRWMCGGWQSWQNSWKKSDEKNYFPSSKKVSFTPPAFGLEKLSSNVGALAGTGEISFLVSADGSSAERNAPSTSCTQWIFIGGSGPSSPASSSVLSASASSAVLPRISSVARLATAMAVSQPKD